MNILNSIELIFFEWIFRILFWIEFWIESYLGPIQWKNEFSKRISQGYSWVPCAFGNVLHQFNEDHRRQLNIKAAFLSLVLTYNFCNIELDALKSKQINAFHFSFPESNLIASVAKGRAVTLFEFMLFRNETAWSAKLK